MANEYNEQAKKFLADYGLTLSVREAIPQKTPLWGGKHGINYWCSLVNKEGKSYSFDFWDSIANKEHRPFTKRPTAYDILACLDTFADGMTFEDFCANYGYDTDSRTAEKTFKQVQYQTEKLKEILSAEAQEALNEIQ